MQTLALCVICHDRPDEVVDALASAAQGFAEAIVVDMASNPPLQIEDVRLIRLDENFGVTRGRNVIADAATADVLVFLDDDAVFQTAGADTIRAAFGADQRLGALAFKIVRRDGRIESSEYPFRGKPTGADEPRPCAYFVGGACAIRRTALNDIGGYDEKFFYSTEEVDVAFRLIAAGWRIAFEPSVVVEHRPSEHGRSIRPHVPAMRMRNRIVLARRYLPWPFGIIHVAAWTLRTAREARDVGALRSWAAGWREGVRVETFRTPLPFALLWRIHRLGGRVLW